MDKDIIKEERIYLGSYEIYRKFDQASSLIIERTTVHISDDTGRIAMLEKRTYGTAADDNNTAQTLTRYIYSNHLQSATLELDENAAIISYEEYHPYGTTSYQANNAAIKAVAKRYRYTGKERDEESGLYYHGARYYIPWLCRWTAVDPLDSKYAGKSPYNYGFNNPVKWTDSTGMGPDDLTNGQAVDISNAKGFSVPTADNTRVYQRPPTYNLYFAPNGAILQLPITAKVLETFSGGEASWGDEENRIAIHPLESSVWKFLYKGETYSAMFNDSSGAFSYYQSETNAQHILGIGVNTTPKVDPNQVRNDNLAMAGSVAISGSERPHPLIALGAIVLSGYFLKEAMTAGKTMDLPIGVYNPMPFTHDDATTKPVALPYADAIAKAPNDPDKDYFVKYTNKEDLDRIMKEGLVLRPNDKGKVYLTKSFFTPQEVETKIFLGTKYGKGRGDYMLMFFVDRDQSANIKKSISDIYEWTYSPGSLKIRPGNLLYIGPNLKR